MNARRADRAWRITDRLFHHACNFPPIRWRCWWEDHSPRAYLLRFLWWLHVVAGLWCEACEDGWAAFVVPRDACRYWFPPRIKAEYVKWGRTP